ncbi:MAG: nucleotide-binding protein [Promethearchaeota archaeon]
MGKIIAFSGKGGVGKTTSLVLFLKYLIENKNNYSILVIDSDPDANVADIIGEKINFCDTIGGKMAELKKKIEKMQIPVNVPKTDIVESDIFECLIEKDEFDLLVMSRSEGSGCYCSINNMLKNYIDILSKNYDITLFDSPAGLEHFARRTGRDITDLIIVSDPSKMGMHTMKRILEITDEVNLKFERVWILGNRFPEDLYKVLEQEVIELKRDNVELLGFIPSNDEISRINILEGNLLELSNNNVAYNQAKELFSKII